MKILDRYIARAVWLGTLIVMAVLLTLMGIFSLMKELKQVGVGDYAASDAFVASLLSLPGILFEIFPVTVLIGGLLGLGGLATQGELTAMRSAGVSNSRLLLSVLKAGFLMLVLVSIIGEVVAPFSEDYVRQIKLEKQQKQIAIRSQHGFWAKDGQEFINIRKILPGPVLKDIYIYRLDDDRQLIQTTYAKTARYEEGHWNLQSIRQTTLHEDRVSSRHQDQVAWDSVIDPGLLSIIVVEPSLLPAWGLYHYIRFMDENRQDSTVYQVAFWTKIITPLTTLVMLVLAFPFVLGSFRAVSIGQRVFLGTILGTVFYVLNRAFSYVAVVYDVQPLLSVSLPAIIMLMVSFFFIRRLA